jgi:hypothetical protein
MAKPTKPAAEPSEVGQSYSLVIERHANKPFWRLRERITSADGALVAETATKWERAPEFFPDFNMCHGRMRRFLFGTDARMPVDLVKT